MARIVIAYKFLAAGGVAPFTGFRWPVGEWVEVDRLEPCRGGIRVALDCADVCDATARIATRQSRPDIRLVRAMIEACAAAYVAGSPCSTRNDNDEGRPRIDLGEIAEGGGT